MKFTAVNVIKSGLILTAISTLGACASAPKPAPPIAEAPAQRLPDKPVFQERAELPQVDSFKQEPVFQPLPENYVTPGSVEDFVASAGDRIFFGYDQSTLSTQARDILRAQANWMNSYPQVIAVIGGHADERGTREYNLSLGEKRASAVKDFLVSQGVDPSRVTTVSYGKERPIAGGSDEQSWALNRNGHTAIVAGANS